MFFSLGFKQIIAIVFWKDVEEYEKKGWWICKQKGYCEDWEKGGIIMSKIIL